MLMIEKGSGKRAIPRMARNADGSLRLTGRGRSAVPQSQIAVGGNTPPRRPSFLYRFFRIGGNGSGADTPDIGEIWKDQELLRAEREAEENRKDAELRARWAARARSLRQLSSRGHGIRIKPTKTESKLRVVFRKLQPRFYILGGALIVLVVGALMVAFGTQKQTDEPIVAGVTTQDEQAGLPQEKPSISLLFPNGDNKRYSQVLRRVSPDGTPAVYVFVDTVGGVRTLVSQQELPDAFKEDLDERIKKMATDFQATSVIVVDGETIYHGVSERDGVQSIIFAKDGNLFLVKADTRLSDAQLSGYYVSLQ